MTDALDFLMLCLAAAGYGTVGSLVALGNYRNIVARTGSASSDDRAGCFFAGLLWPIGMWVVIFGLVTGPKLVRPQHDLPTKAQKEREKRIMREREDLRLDIEEHQNRMASAEFHRRRMLEIEADNKQDE